METPEVVELALCKIEGSLGELSGHRAAGHVGWMLPTAVERVIKERDELRYALTREQKLLKTKVTLLTDILVAWEGGSRKM